MTSLSLETRFTETIKTLQGLLKPEGFKRSGLKLYRLGDNGNGLIIEFQKDKWNSDAEFRFKINLGVYSAAMTALLNGVMFFKVPQVPSVSHCVVKSWLFAEDEGKPHQAWWETSSEVSSADLAEKIKQKLVPTLAELTKLTDNEVLCEAWLRGESRGLSELQRHKYLLAMLSILGRTDQLETKAQEVAEKHGKVKLRDVLPHLNLASL